MWAIAIVEAELIMESQMLNFMAAELRERGMAWASPRRSRIWLYRD